MIVEFLPFFLGNRTARDFRGFKLIETRDPQPAAKHVGGVEISGVESGGRQVLLKEHR